ncbi:hypothetical protein [Deinococcus ficus]|uniref:hypothetical protein n=1 Tax=Deinococcus ficus TaxID=317577 RepID=UPI0003B533ED|nr:hypothetical protein [Deinococcus ficus]
MLRLPALLTLLTLLTAAPAQALKVMVVDAELQSTLGYGETSGGRLNLQLVGNYNGPVVLLFAQTDAEKKAGLFPGLQARYDGTLRGGVLSLSEGSANPVTLDKFLKGFKLTLGVNTPAVTLPGLKTQENGNNGNNGNQKK